jgi:hypothetical protein
MPLAYFDEVTDDSTIFLVGGWMAEGEEWDRFTDKWRRALSEAPGCAYFKHHEAMSLTAEFAGWTPEARDAKLCLLANVVVRHDLHGLVGGVNLKQFKAAFENSQLNKKQLKGVMKITHPYHSCFHGVVGQTIQLEAQKGDAARRVDFVFDDHPGMLAECIKQLNEAREMIPATLQAITGSMTAANDKESAPLQAADFLVGQILLSLKQGSHAEPLRIVVSERRIAQFASFPPQFQHFPAYIEQLNTTFAAKEELRPLLRLLEEWEKRKAQANSETAESRE